MRKLGILWIIYGLLRFAGVLGIFVSSVTLTLMWGALLTRVPNPYGLMDSFHFFLVFLMILGVIAGTVSVIAGLKLMGGRESSRRLGLLAATLGLINGPLGIALGAYTLVILVPKSEHAR
jgi:hypothetical protein